MRLSLSIRHIKSIVKNNEDVDRISNKIKNVDVEVLNILKKVLEDKIAQEEGTSHEDFNKPDWALYRAYKDGRIEGLKEVINMIVDKE